MSILDIVKTANQNLLRNKVRTFLTILAIFIGSFTIISNTAIQAGVNSFIDNQVDAYGGDGFITITASDTIDSLMSQLGSASDEPEEYDPERNQTSATPITDEQVQQIKDLDSIDADSVRSFNSVVISYVASDETDKKFVLEASILPPGDINIDTTAGTKPDLGSDEYQITLPPNYAEALGYGSDEDIVGKEITLAVQDTYTQTYANFTATVVGVQAPGIVTQGSAIVNSALGDAIYAENTKYYPEDQKTTVYALTARYDYENYTDQEIKDQLGEINLSGMTVSDIVGSIKSFFDIIIAVFNIFGFIALLAAAIGIINTLFMSVQERTREIGLDKALGMSSGKIFLTFSIEAISLGFWGSVLGTIISMIVGYAANAAFHATGGFLEAFPTFNLVEYTPINVAILMGIIMVVAFLAGTLPARQAAAKNPIDALRYE
jgi:putative ABC transport system permease protein